MPVLTKTALINDPEVREEIDRYKWIESERFGQDIGFDRAAEEWFIRCSDAWLQSRAVPQAKPCSVPECTSSIAVEKKPVRKAKKS